MGRKRKQVGPSVPCPNADWIYVVEIQINGRNVSAGTELKITGERGRYRFIRQVTTDKGAEWIDVWGGPKGSEQWRSFRLDKVGRVHYKNTTDKAMAAEYKAKKAAIKEENANE